MAVVKITGSALKSCLGYVSCSVGTQASAKQDSGLMYFETISDSEAMVQIQGDSIVSKTVVAIETDDDFSIDEPVKALIDYNVLTRYSKLEDNGNKFEFDFSETEDDETLTIKLGTKLIGKAELVPLDAFELEKFEDLVEVATVNSEALEQLIKMSSQFINTKKDAQDYVQILGEEDKVIVFTTDGDIISTFEYKLPDDIDEFDVTVRGSALKKLQGFGEMEITLSTTDDEYFLVMKDGDDRLKAVVLHTDPPYTYEELKEDLETTSVSDTKDIRNLSWSVDEMAQALQSVECSSTDGKFELQIKDNDTLVLLSEGLSSTSTRTEVLIQTDKDIEDLADIGHESSISLFRKLNILNSTNGKKVSLEFESKVDEDENLYLDDIECNGTVGSIDYRISFGVFPSV
jgi:DNA polymerase III sliding clamp (beta) subunit (PCNA family)|tara:strand:+ start:985 stop:2193 length:1209 start_codon:yes stop_codon:yes gene_type:complete